MNQRIRRGMDSRISLEIGIGTQEGRVVGDLDMEYALGRMMEEDMI